MHKSWHHLILALLFAIVTGAMARAAGGMPELPPVIGTEKPLVKPVKGDDGLFHQSWFVESFLNLREDFAEARAQGKRFAVMFEQRGCVYCIKMHTEVLAKKYINDYVRQNFHIVQLNLWGDREVTDFDGTVVKEKELARRWGVIFTPWIIFYKDDMTGLDGKWGQPLEVLRMGLGMGPGTFYDMFTWIRVKGNESGEHFQRFHIRRLNERAAITKSKTAGEDQKVN